jgi:hypothetical protein
MKSPSGAWMFRYRAPLGPGFVNPWTIPGGTATDVPGPARNVSVPFVNSSSPSRT